MSPRVTSPHFLGHATFWKWKGGRRQTYPKPSTTTSLGLEICPYDLWLMTYGLAICPYDLWLMTYGLAVCPYAALPKTLTSTLSRRCSCGDLTARLTPLQSTAAGRLCSRAAFHECSVQLARKLHKRGAWWGPLTSAQLALIEESREGELGDVYLTECGLALGEGDAGNDR